MCDEFAQAHRATARGTTTRLARSEETERRSTRHDGQEKALGRAPSDYETERSATFHSHQSSPTRSEFNIPSLPSRHHFSQTPQHALEGSINDRHRRVSFSSPQ